MRPKELPSLTTKQIDRMWSKIDKRGPEECWLWTGNKTRNQRGGGYYGLVSIKGRGLRPYRIVYELCVGKIPEGFTIDHVKARGCTNPLCCNPAHLEAVTQYENRDRHARTVTTCNRGHSITRNLKCRVCAAIYGKSYNDAVKPGLYARNILDLEAAKQQREPKREVA